ncbi:MAG TPA: sugar phosphate nucleotidyltransferase [Gemmatimonadales bacterium]|nr:sugar phosphate nucleotidyltransferase [Gemmatimonadales bacterium]
MTIAVIPCGGRGTRLAHLSQGQPKELLPVAGKPLLQWTLEEAAAAGLRRAVVVTSPDKPQLARFLADRPVAGLSVGVALQPEPRGLGDAITRARDLAGAEPVAVLLPDNLFSTACAIAPVLRARDATGFAAVLTAEIASRDAGTKGATGRIRAVPRPDGLLAIQAIADKGPSGARFDTGGGPAALTPIGRMVFDAGIFELLESLRARLAPGAELDDVPALQTLAREGRLVGVPLPGAFYDVGVPEGYQNALAALT